MLENETRICRNVQKKPVNGLNGPRNFSDVNIF